MKPLLTFLTLCIGISAFAQSEPGDSVPTYQLDELKVEASRVIRKADMDVYHPSLSAVENSNNGLQLLTNISIPSVMVDEVMGKITASGSNVELRINGRVSSVEQVRNLQPESVKRIEWLDNPGLRYNGASYVLNFIVTNPDNGGSFMMGVQPMFNVLFGNYHASLKLNHSRSQWSVSAYFKPMSSTKVHRQYYETFTFPDGEELTRKESPLGGKVKNYFGWGSLAYSYIKPDTTVFYANVSAWSNMDDLGRFNGLLTLSDNSTAINLLNETSGKGITPSLSLYLEQHLAHRQTLVADFSASVYSGFSESKYLERYPESSTYITDINTHIRDLNQAYALEADYIKDWDNAKFTAGFNYSANRNRSKYRNLNNEVFHQRQDKVYFFGEYFHRLGKFTITGGLGAQYTSFLFEESKQGSHSWNLRPQATLTYSPNSNHQLRLNFTSYQISPSLSETNIAPQQVDGFQWNIGNPNLRTYNVYRLDLRYAFNFWRISGNFIVNTSTSPKAIAPYLYWENDRLITSYENSKGKQTLSFRLAPQIQVVPQWLTIAGEVEYLNERTRGTGYKLYNHSWSGNVQAIATHWNFTFIMQYQRAQRSLWGEKLSWGEDSSSIILAYNWKDWQFGALMFMPFGKYDQGSRMLSKYNTNDYHLRLDFKMVGIMINYNLNWGKQKSDVSKLIDSEASVEKSSAKTR